MCVCGIEKKINRVSRDGSKEWDCSLLLDSYTTAQVHFTNEKKRKKKLHWFFTIVRTRSVIVLKIDKWWKIPWKYTWNITRNHLVEGYTRDVFCLASILHGMIFRLGPTTNEEEEYSKNNTRILNKHTTKYTNKPKKRKFIEQRRQRRLIFFTLLFQFAFIWTQNTQQIKY